MRPWFKYQFANVSVEDSSIDPPTHRPAERSCRTLTMKSESGSPRLTFRAASGKKIEQTADDTFVVDDQLTIRVDTNTAGLSTAKAT